MTRNPVIVDEPVNEEEPTDWSLIPDDDDEPFMESIILPLTKNLSHKNQRRLERCRTNGGRIRALRFYDRRK